MNVEIQHASVGPKPNPNLWFFKLHGLERGPVTWEVLQNLACSGDLKPSDLVRRDGEEQWVVATRARAQDSTRDAGSTRAASAGAASALTADAGPVPAARPAGRAAREAIDPGPAEPDTEPDAAPRPPAAVAAPAAQRSDHPAGTALLALGLGLVGVFKLALPLGLLSIYLGGRSARALGRRPAAAGGSAALAAAAAAVLVGLLDVGVSLYVIGGRLVALRAQLALGE
jgi:hypothetical protein